MVSIRRALLPFYGRGARFLPVCAIVCPFEPNDSESRLFFGFSLGSSCTCINLPRNGDMVLKIMSGLSQTRTGTAGRSGLCLRTEFGGDALEGVADGVDGMVVFARQHTIKRVIV